jgi:hypothetical protein
VVNFVHKHEQPADFTVGESLAGKPVQVVTGQIGDKPAFVPAIRHAPRHQELEVLGVHAVSPVNNEPKLMSRNAHTDGHQVVTRWAGTGHVFFP